MITLSYLPDWFYGVDILIDAISMVVLLLIAYYSLRYYVVSNKKINYLLLTLSFVLLSIAFLSKIFMNLAIYFPFIEFEELNELFYTYNLITTATPLFLTGFLIYRILTLVGLYLLFAVYYKQDKMSMGLTIYLLLMLSYFSGFEYYIFHITTFILLSLITIKYYINYKTYNDTKNKFILTSFFVISLSQAIFIFIDFNAISYIVAELIQLVGYSLLSITFGMVLFDAKKKRA